jgi:serine phosphatase RsbU (regulator of sigma subunit)/tetratricopeptide (TPR) repeat protein
MKTLMSRILLALVLVSLLLNLTACQKGEPISPKDSEADSLNLAAENMIRAVAMEGDVERTLELADSLRDQNRLTPIKADFYKSFVYFCRGDEAVMTEYLEKIIETYENTDADPIIYTRAAVVLTNHYMSQNHFEAALRVALPVMARYGQDPAIPLDRKGRLLTIIGACQERLNRPNEAKKSFEQAYQYFRKYMEEEDLDFIDFSSCITSVQNIFNIYTTTETLNEQKKWTDRCASMLSWYRNQPDAESSFVDRVEGQIALKRAEIQVKQGKRARAAKAYREFLNTEYSKTDDARLNSIDYLTNAGRNDEAADILQDFDRMAAEWGMEPNLEFIMDFLFPKFNINYMAGRKDSALAVALKISSLIDSAVVEQKNGAAAELATIYETQEKDLQIAEQKMRMSRARILALIVSIIALTLFFAIFTIIRYRAAKRLAKVNAAKERMEGELNIARDIQMSMVPSQFPDYKGLDMYASMTPAREVGGDLYNYFFQGNQLYFCVGDVSGKGVPASLFMSQATRLFHALASQGMNPAEIATRMNAELAENNEQGMFITMFICRLNLRLNLFEYCNAGHNPPVLGNADGQFSFLDMETNAPIGLWPGLEYKGESIEFFKDRLLLLYTDGLNEAENCQQEQFGEDRILDILKQTQYASAQQIIETMADAVSQHRNGAEANDDLTMLCIRMN